MKSLKTWAIGCVLASCTFSASAELTVKLFNATADGKGEAVGQVVLSDSPYGLVVTPSMHGLSPGLHGFHIHENPSCDAKDNNGKPVPALAAGGHFDPDKSGKHGFAWGDGHLGDLPALYVDEHGHAQYPVLAPRLTVAKVKDRSIMVHAGGDNHSDHPAPLGGGGARVACGVIR